MPGTSTTGSTNIALLDSKIVADLCAGKFYIDVTPSIYIADGAENVLGANVQITNPAGIVVKPYGANYEIAPALSGGMDGIISFNVPTIAGNYQYGKYKIDVQLFDGSSSWVVTKYVTLCEPDKNKKNRNYRTLSATMKGSCKDGKLYVMMNTPANYNGKMVESQEVDLLLQYPYGAEEDYETELTSFVVQLYEGTYKLSGEICATFNMGDNVYVKIKHKILQEKTVRCLIDECCVLSKLAELHLKINTDCTQEERELTANLTLDALRLLKTAQMAADCGEDHSSYIEDLEKLLGCTCTCNCEEGTPIINNEPAGDIVIEGCNVTKTEEGLTTHYSIENYEYVIQVTENGGALTISAPTLDNCTKTQVLSFSIAAVYNQIKTLANQNSTEQGFWASVINANLDALTIDCLEDDAWVTATFDERIQIMLDKICGCCGCTASILAAGATSESGNNVQLVWEWNVPGERADIFLDGIFQGSVLYPGNEWTFENVADGAKHTYKVIPKCSNGHTGEIAEDEFMALACPDIAPADISSTLVEDADCPYDLEGLENTPPLGIAYEWHTADDTSPDTLLPDPTSVSSGIYWVFAKDADGCYSIGRKVTIICAVATSCTAPQNLEVVKLLLCNHFVKFKSAAYPPPGNSYTVKRRLATDPDIPASYTTIGTPTWNAGIQRWVICDNTASNNTLYVYVAQSNCGDSPMTTPSTSFEYAYMTCPVVTPTPASESISYSLTPPGGEVSMIKVQLYNEDGSVLISEDTYTPAFSSPIIGEFDYLSPSTNYKILVITYIDDYESDCEFLNTATTA